MHSSCYGDKKKTRLQSDVSKALIKRPNIADRLVYTRQYHDRAMEIFKKQAVGDKFLKGQAFGRVIYNTVELHLEEENELEDVHFIIYLAHLFANMHFNCDIYWVAKRSKVDAFKTYSSVISSEGSTMCSDAAVAFCKDALVRAAKVYVRPCKKSESPIIRHHVADPAEYKTECTSPSSISTAITTEEHSPKALACCLQ